MVLKNFLLSAAGMVLLCGCQKQPRERQLSTHQFNFVEDEDMPGTVDTFSKTEILSDSSYMNGILFVKVQGSTVYVRAPQPGQ